MVKKLSPIERKDQMATVISIKGAHQPPKASQSKMDTLILTQSLVNNWKVPPFQRPLRINCKVQMVAERIRQDQVIEGILTLGMIKGEQPLYIVDGQHRIEAFKLSAIPEAIADVRIVVFSGFDDMAEEFVQLNSALVRMRPDDILRGSESSIPALRSIRNSCEFVGYDQVRRGGLSGPIVSMSALLRCWGASQYEVPAPSNIGGALTLARSLDARSVSNLTAFLSVAFAAWGRDPEYFRLWGNLNMAICMWMWNKLVIDRERFGNRRYAILDIPMFKKCLMSVSADMDYVSWLVGRNLSDRDRSPAYNRLKAIFSSRLAEEGKSSRLPQPAWGSK
jgi:hypothetical protein